MIELVKAYYPNFERLEESPIQSSSETVGWSVTLLERGNNPIGSGCSSARDTARRVAVAEAIERGVFRSLFKRDAKPFLLDEFPTTSGFAAGFEDVATKWRAISEGLERWIWSQWIDQKYAIGQIYPAKDEIGKIGCFFLKEFEDAKFFHKRLTVAVEGCSQEFQFAACVGLTDRGAFPGSRVCSPLENPWEHAIIEAWRHTKIAKKLTAENALENFYNARVKYFSEHKGEALVSIGSAMKIDEWPEPKLRLLRKVPSLPKGLFVWRALFADFEGWHLGNHKRFVY
jgi:hypothetical protein